MGGKKDVRKGKVGKPAKDIIPVTLGKPPREGNIVGYPDVANI